jgi:uncharacterized protein (TIGR03437 family)
MIDFGPPAANAARNGASLARGTIAPGSLFRFDTFNLTNITESSPTPVPVLAGVRVSIVDAAGRTLPVPMTKAGRFSWRAVVPLAASLGIAMLIVQPPEGPSLSQPVTIRRADGRLNKLRKELSAKGLVVLGLDG